MGAHAFAGEPEHCTVYRANVGPNLPQLYGVAEGWNMPVARHRRALGHGVHFRGVDHYVLTLHLGGGSARRLKSATPMAQTGAISLQAPGSGGTFSSKGVVDYAHLYFHQSLVCEVADHTGYGIVAEPADFFGHVDPILAKDIEVYVARALDTRDPPSVAEMDNRAFLIAHGLLRSVLLRSGQAVRLSETVERADLRAVLSEIEERLGEKILLDELALTAGLSPAHLSRLFRAETGMTPAEYLRNRRVDRAVEMLRRTRLPIAEIAFQTGFSSQSHMSRAVRSATGSTPSAIRNGG